MIFITLGTQKFQMDRLLQGIDSLISEEKITDEVIAQIGHSTYIPKNFKYTKFLDDIKFQECIENCDLLITHAGVGNIIKGLKLNKKIIVFPRLKKFNEHVDDHQLEIAEHFEKKKFVLLCTSVEDLHSEIIRSSDFRFQKYSINYDGFVFQLTNYLDEWGFKRFQ